MHQHISNSYRQCLMKDGENSCGWETTSYLNNVLTSGSDAGSLSKGCHSDGGGAALESWPHKPESKPHTSAEMWRGTTLLRSGMRVTFRSKSKTSPQSLAGSQHCWQQGIYVWQVWFNVDHSENWFVRNCSVIAAVITSDNSAFMNTGEAPLKGAVGLNAHPFWSTHLRFE